MTVASASTHLDDGPRHSLHETVDAETSPEHHDGEGEQLGEAAAGMAGESISLSSLFGGGGGSAKASTSTSPFVGLGDAIRFPSLSGGGKPYQAPKNRPMTAEERRGVWVLAGLLGGGVLVSKLAVD